MSSPRALDLAAIPSRSMRTVIDAVAPVLVWVIAGSATADSPALRVTIGGGHALWIPGGVRTVVRGDAGSCVLPIRVRSEDQIAGPPSPFTAEIPLAARSTLLSLFTRSLGVLHGGGVPASAILSTLGHRTAIVEAPSMPRSPLLHRIAEQLLANPTTSPAQLGAAQGLGESVLARRFRAETGWTPVRWRTRQVLADAAERICRHGSVSAGVAATAYATPQAFARAFRREWGFAPGRLLGGETSIDPIAPGSDALGPQRNGYHVVFWVATGGADLTIDGRIISVHRGDVFCLPAGHAVGYRTRTGSAIIPLGWLPGGFTLPSGVVGHVDESADECLIRLSAWAYADITPGATETARRTLELVLGLDAPSGIPAEVVDAAYALLDRLSRTPEDGTPTTTLAARSGVAPGDLRDAIEALTGTTLPVWRSRTRMLWARRLLRDGMHATQVARRLGYADAASFSRAFAQAHGCSPTRFRVAEQRRSGPPEDPLALSAPSRSHLDGTEDAPARRRARSS